MDFEPAYEFALTEKHIRKFFPKLVRGNNFLFTSKRTDIGDVNNYNCIAWAVQNINEWIEFILDEDGNYDINVAKYIKYFVELGFVETNDRNYIEGFVKVAIYSNKNNDFTHVARLLQNGKWTSKIGEWEDIEHNSIEDLEGDFYGSPSVILQKAV